MANLPETSTFDAGIYQLERTDKADAGIAGAGLSNLQAKGLANRTVYLKNQIDLIKNRVNFYIAYTNQTVANNTSVNAKGTAYVFNFPLSDWDYTTPNDGVTRDYMIELTCTVGVGFTYNGTGSVNMILHTTTAGPTQLEYARAVSYNPGQTIHTRKKISVGPNVRIKAFISIGNVSGPVPITDASFHMEEIF